MSFYSALTDLSGLKFPECLNHAYSLDELALVAQDYNVFYGIQFCGHSGDLDYECVLSTIRCDNSKPFGEYLITL